MHVHASDFDRAFRFTGQDVRRLMRQNGVTIRELSQRMGLHQRRVRSFRSAGVCGFAACDVYEAITGSLSDRMRAAFRSRLNA